MPIFSQSIQQGKTGDNLISCSTFGSRPLNYFFSNFLDKLLRNSNKAVRVTHHDVTWSHADPFLERAMNTHGNLRCRNSPPAYALSRSLVPRDDWHFKAFKKGSVADAAVDDGGNAAPGAHGARQQITETADTLCAHAGPKRYNASRHVVDGGKLRAIPSLEGDGLPGDGIGRASESAADAYRMQTVIKHGGQEMQ